MAGCRDIDNSDFEQGNPFDGIHRPPATLAATEADQMSVATNDDRQLHSVPSLQF